MLVITKLIMIGIAVVCAVTLAFIVLEFVGDKVMSKLSKKRNRVKFYVARDKNGIIWLYIGKPYRDDDMFYGDLKKGSCTMCCNDFEIFGINENDYKDLKWEDEPVEVFLNMED